MERMRLGADDTSISDPDPEFDPDDPEYIRLAYTGGFTLSVFGASTGSAGYSVEEEGNVSGLTDRGYGTPCLAHPATGAAAKPWEVLSPAQILVARSGQPSQLQTVDRAWSYLLKCKILDFDT